MDVDDNALMTARTWRWLRTRILGLIDHPVHLDPFGQPVWATRLQEALNPPAETRQQAQR